MYVWQATINTPAAIPKSWSLQLNLIDIMIIDHHDITLTELTVQSSKQITRYFGIECCLHCKTKTIKITILLVSTVAWNSMNFNLACQLL